MKWQRIVLLAIISVPITSLQAANLLTNGDFEDGNTNWTQWFGGNSLVPVADPVEPDNAAGVWWTDDGMYQEISNLEPGRYLFGGNILRHADFPLINGRRAVIQAELSDGANPASPWWVQTLFIDETFPTMVWSDPLEWTPGAMVIDTTGTDATFLRINLFLIENNPNPNGEIRGVGYFDNIFVIPENDVLRASDPNPADGAVVGTGLTQLSWTNPEPNVTGNTITADVYLKVQDSDPNFYPENLIVGGTTAVLVDLASAGVTLQDDTTYVWRVDPTDPNIDGQVVTTTGDTWQFSTGDTPPVADAGADQYVWLVNGEVTFTLPGIVTDDGKSPVTTEWVYNAGNSDTDPATVVSIATPTALSTEVTIDNTGTFEFQLNADDSFGHDDDVVLVFVYGTCLEAAEADPTDDIAGRFPNGHGDLDGDCDADIVDFAILAGTYLQCLTEKAGCLLP